MSSFASWAPTRATSRSAMKPRSTSTSRSNPGDNGMRPLFIVSLFAFSPAALCAQEKAEKGNKPIKVVELPRKDAVHYEKDVEPIFRKRCMACHSGSIKEGRFDMGSYESLVKGGKRGAAVVPGKAES